MQSFGKFTQYTPTDKGKVTSLEGRAVLYLRDEQGNDWYDTQKLFSENTLKVGYDEEGRVRTFCTDVYAFFPMNLAAVELPATKANMRVSLGDDWFYKDGKLQQIRDQQAIAATERDNRMSEATRRIDWLTGALEDGDISEDETAELEALRAYRAALRRLDLTTAPKIGWPAKPELA